MTLQTLAERIRARPLLLLCILLALVSRVAPAQDLSLGTETPARGIADADSTDEDVRREVDDEPQLQVIERIEVKSRADELVGIADAASDGTTGAEDLARRPLTRAGELVETVPGVIASQHSGGGKANQYFVRGFNLDHGTDFSISVDGMPVNMPSHGHGQGWADLNFLIPEMVERVRYRKGAYAADKGDFSAAGAVDIDFISALEKGLLRATTGSFGFARALAADSFDLGGGVLVAGFEAYRNDGPWERGDDYRRGNALLRYGRGDATRGWSLTALGYDGDWRATDQIPRRAVESGRVGRFGSVDPTDGGSASRYSLSGALRRGSDRSLTLLTAYVVKSDLSLFSNFTYFLEDPERGDQFEQLDSRWTAGLAANRQWLTSWRGKTTEFSTGLDLRFDDIDNGLLRTQERARFATTRVDAIEQWTGGPWAKVATRWSNRVRSTLGLRADFYRAHVASDRAANSGSESDAILSPKVGLVLGPWRQTELYVNLGYGHHSNDARGTTIRIDPLAGGRAIPVDPLVRARSGEIGLRTAAVAGLQSTLAVFALEVDSEIVFLGDAGGTEAGRPSRRIGIEWTNHWHTRRWLDVDLDAALTDARFTDGDLVGNEIPGALAHVVAAGISLHDRGPWAASLRLRYFGGYPLIEDNSARAGSITLLNAQVSYALPRGLRFVAEGFNLLDDQGQDIAYFYASRLPGEPEEGIQDVHFHPIEKPSLRLAVEWTF